MNGLIMGSSIIELPKTNLFKSLWFHVSYTLLDDNTIFVDQIWCKMELTRRIKTIVDAYN